MISISACVNPLIRFARSRKQPMTRRPQLEPDQLGDSVCGWGPNSTTSSKRRPDCIVQQAGMVYLAARTNERPPNSSRSWRKAVTTRLSSPCSLLIGSLPSPRRRTHRRAQPQLPREQNSKNRPRDYETSHRDTKTRQFAIFTVTTGSQARQRAPRRSTTSRTGRPYE